MTENKTSESIYLTYKTRMTTERRFRLTQFVGNCLIVWYSFALIVFSVLDLSGRFTISSFSIISLTVSMATLTVSLILSGQKYGERADNIRSCYLKLQQLYQSNFDETEKMSRYADILSQYENQLDTDFDEMVFDAWTRNQSLRNAEGPVSLSFMTAFRVLAKRSAKIALVILFFAFPIIFGLAWIEPVLQQNGT